MTTHVPKILYIFDKTPCNRASVFIIQFLDDDADEQEFEDPVEYERLSTWFKNDPLSKRMKRGDVLHNVSMGDYRNDGKFIYDGEKLCYPYNTPFADSENSDDPDEYGYVPRQFLVVNEFPIRYWSEIIDHNFYVYSDLTDIIDHITWHASFGDKKLFIGTFTPPATTHIPNPGLHAILSDTKDIPKGVQLFAYDICIFEDMFDSPTCIQSTIAEHGVNLEENVLVYSTSVSCM